VTARFLAVCGADSQCHSVRLCHLRMVDSTAGYGFNMQGHSDQRGHFITVVDRGSAADSAGLRAGDRIIEVNGVNVEAASHGDVADKIRALSAEVTLLVVDPDADRFFNSESIDISGASTSDHNYNESAAAELTGQCRPPCLLAGLSLKLSISVEVFLVR